MARSASCATATGGATVEHAASSFARASASGSPAAYDAAMEAFPSAFSNPGALPTGEGAAGEAAAGEAAAGEAAAGGVAGLGPGMGPGMGPARHTSTRPGLAGSSTTW